VGARVLIRMIGASRAGFRLPLASVIVQRVIETGARPQQPANIVLLQRRRRRSFQKPFVCAFPQIYRRAAPGGILYRFQSRSLSGQTRAQLIGRRFSFRERLVARADGTLFLQHMKWSRLSVAFIFVLGIGTGERGPAPIVVGLLGYSLKVFSRRRPHPDHPDFSKPPVSVLYFFIPAVQRRIRHRLYDQFGAGV